MPLFGVEFGAQAGEGAGGFGGFVGGAGDTFAGAFVVIEAVRRGLSVDRLGTGNGEWGDRMIGDVTVSHVALSSARCIHFGAVGKIKLMIL